MPDTVKLPVVGPTSKRTLYLGGGAAVLVMGVLWWRKRNAPAPAAPTDAAATDTSGLDTSGLGSGMAGGGGALVGPSVSGVTAATTNAQWFANAGTALSGVVDPSALAAALGAYLTGNAVTTDQQTIIDQAVGAAGWPPVSGPNGYPPGIRTQPATGQTPAPTPTPSAGGGGDWTTHTTVHEGERLSQILDGFGMTQADFEAHNPGITQYYRSYVAGKGYVAAGTPGAVIALNTGHDVAVLVRSGGW